MENIYDQSREEASKESIRCLANQFRQNEVERVGGREFACRLYKLEQFIELLDEEKARDLAYKMLNNKCKPELKGYIIAWFEGSGYGGYTLGQIVANIGERQVSAESVELLALW